ncbi:MAG: class I SAM-dependent rRNA methyltransferase, partial [Erysipelotrichaceae bacterium]|nr:class I SAM-dependent rRNA methyltransferase [Erysipelotrichaceae bacterium]
NRGYPVNGIYERNDAAIRKLEGLPQYSGWFGKPAEITSTVIEENGLKMEVNFVEGQKTGYFLDQRNNRAAVGNIAQGKRVLDCFTHTGSFALNCARGGASKVTAVDISQTALEQAKVNAALNGLEDKISFICADVFEYLDGVHKKEYDLIILDPPAFTNSRKTVQNAYNGYLEINMKAMQLLGRGGYLATCSCSHFMEHELFVKMLKEASYRTGFALKQISISQQAPDHPIMMNVPETDYLKFFIFQLV